MTKDTFTKSAYGAYEKGISTDTVKDNADAASTWMKLNLATESSIAALEASQQEIIKKNIPPQYDVLKKSISDAITTGVNLNPTIVKEIAPDAVTTEGVVDINKIPNKDVFAETYLAYMIPKLIKL